MTGQPIPGISANNIAVPWVSGSTRECNSFPVDVDDSDEEVDDDDITDGDLYDEEYDDSYVDDDDSNADDEDSDVDDDDSDIDDGDEDMSSGMFHDHRAKSAVHVCILLALLSVCPEQLHCGVEAFGFAVCTLMHSTLQLHSKLQI